MVWTATPGWHHDVPNDEYHADTAAVSASYLKTLILDCPAAARLPHEQTQYMLEGSAGHAMIDGTFERDYRVMPEGWTGRSKADKEQRAALEAEGLTVITHDQHATARACADALLAHPVVQDLLPGASHEVVVVWRDQWTGALCKARADLYRADLLTVTDWKLMQDVRPLEFQRAVANYGYHLQAAFYLDGFTQGLGTFAWAAAAKKPPHGVRVYTASRRMLDAGRELYKKALEIHRECARNDLWPAYPTTIEEIDLPVWAY